ncbi:MAG TPA: protein kinase [Pseudonocardia sp.]
MTAPEATLLAGRYRPEAEPDGRYSMAGWPRAVDLLSGQPVALKSVPLAGLDTNGIAAVREWATHAARLRHANVVTVLDVLVTKDELVLVSEHWPSRPADLLLAQYGPMPAQLVTEVGWRLADGLAAAHAADIQHHDINPGNVLFDEGGRAKLVDFGITRAVRDLRNPASSSGSVYLAPEVTYGRAHPTPADVYGLGATLAALAGHPPGTKRSTVPGPLGEVLARMTQVEPAHRPSAAAARDQLLMLSATPDPAASPSQPTTEPAKPLSVWPPPPGKPAAPSTPPAERRWHTRPAVLIPLAVLLVAALVVAGMLVPRWLHQATEPATQGPTTAPSTPSAPSAPPWAAGKNYLPEPNRADLCALRDMADFSGFGAVTKVPSGRYSECGDDIALIGGVATAHVKFSIWLPGQVFPAPTEQRGDLTIVRPEPTDTSCLRQIEFPTQYHLDITVTIDGNATISPCELAEFGADALVRNLQVTGSVPTVGTMGDPSSLRRQDACQLLTAADVAEVPGVNPAAGHPLYGNWACSWGNNPTGPGFRPPAVVVQFQRADAHDPQDQGTQYEIGGRDVYVRVAKGDNDQSMCQADVVHRVAATAHGRPYAELVVLAVYAQVSATKQCQLSVDLAGKLIAQLPPP